MSHQCHIHIISISYPCHIKVFETIKDLEIIGDLETQEDLYIIENNETQEDLYIIESNETQEDLYIVENNKTMTFKLLKILRYLKTSDY